MQRRGFLLGLGTALAAPAVVRASSLMKLWVPPETEWVTYTPSFTGFGTVSQITVTLPPSDIFLDGRVFMIVNNGLAEVRIKSDDNVAFLNPGSRLIAEYPKELSWPA